MTVSEGLREQIAPSWLDEQSARAYLSKVNGGRPVIAGDQGSLFIGVEVAVEAIILALSQQHVRTETGSGGERDLIQQARELHAAATCKSDLADETSWQAEHGWHEPRGSDYWHVTATRLPHITLAAPYTVSKAYVRNPDVAALMTFVSSALPKLCDLAEAALSPLPEAEGEGDYGSSGAERAARGPSGLMGSANPVTSGKEV